MTIELWPAQMKAYEFAIKRDCVALFCEQRTGKTFITLALLRKLAMSTVGVANDFCGVLLTLLTNKDTTWLDNLRTHLPWLNVTTDWEEFKSLPAPRLFLIHFDVFPRIIKKLCKYKRVNWMGIDEAHRISKRGTKQSKACARMSWVRRKLLLTGTPIEKQPTDLFAQFRFLDPEVFGTNWQTFEDEYMDFRKIGMEHTPKGSMAWQKRLLQQRILRSKAKFKASKLPQLIKLIKPYSFRLEKSDVGILEPVVERIDVPMFGTQRKLYEEMEKHSVVRLPTGERSMAELKITQIMKLRQIASGFLYDDDEEVHEVGRAKLRRLRQLVAQASKPVVIFTAFRPDTEAVSRLMTDEGYDAITVHGGIDRKKRPDIWRRFQRAQFDVIVCQIKTGGVGVDLWKANTAIVHSMGHSYIDFDQAKARLDSRDKNKPASIKVLCVANTVDEDIFDLVVMKRLNGNAVLTKLKRRLK